MSSRTSTFIFTRRLIQCAEGGTVGHDHEPEELRALLQLATPLGLYAEAMDPVSDEHLGNFAQALSHAALVQSALALRDAGPDPSRFNPEVTRHRAAGRS